MGQFWEGVAYTSLLSRTYWSAIAPRSAAKNLPSNHVYLAFRSYALSTASFSTRSYLLAIKIHSTRVAPRGVRCEEYQCEHRNTTNARITFFFDVYNLITSRSVSSACIAVNIYVWGIFSSLQSSVVVQAARRRIDERLRILGLINHEWRARGTNSMNISKCSWTV